MQREDDTQGGWNMRGKRVIGALCWIMLTGTAVMADQGETAVSVSYLGPAGTYTEEAAQFFFQNGEVLNSK